MGKSPSIPTYDTAAAQNEQIWAADQNRKYGQVNYNGLQGGYSYQTNPDGTQTLVQNASSADKARQNLQSQYLSGVDPTELSNFNVDPSVGANAYWNEQMTYMQPQFQRQTNDIITNLEKRGIPAGSPQFNQAMQEVADAQNRSMATTSAGAVSAGQQYQTNALNNIINKQGAQTGAAGSLASQMYQVNPYSGTGGTFGGTYDSLYNSQVQQAQLKAQQQNAIMGMVGSIAGAGAGALTGRF
ncbi:MAG: hypothetical protein LBJ18_03675 [Rickettsiales bacterium]|jgi:hypothetical protein|nr:hypothetical protein [Rickettsiales bacterium]